MNHFLRALYILFLSGLLAAHASEECHNLAVSGLGSIGKVSDFARKGIRAANKSKKREEKMGDYKVSGACPTKVKSKIDATYFRCKDGSISYEQPKSTGVKGYNGFCAETAASNILHMQCLITSNPKTYSNHFTDDITPGTRPASLKYGLNKMYQDQKESCPKGTWRTYYGAKSGEEYISHLVGGLNRGKSQFTRTRKDGKKIKRAPFPIMIENPPKGSKGLHWVSLVDIEGHQKNKKLKDQPNCSATINHWGGQYKVPCHRLAAWAKETAKGPSSVVTGSYPRIKFYTEK